MGVWVILLVLFFTSKLERIFQSSTGILLNKNCSRKKQLLSRNSICSICSLIARKFQEFLAGNFDLLYEKLSQKIPSPGHLCVVIFTIRSSWKICMYIFIMLHIFNKNITRWLFLPRNKRNENIQWAAHTKHVCSRISLLGTLSLFLLNNDFSLKIIQASICERELEINYLKTRVFFKYNCVFTLLRGCLTHSGAASVFYKKIFCLPILLLTIWGFSQIVVGTELLHNFLL